MSAIDKKPFIIKALETLSVEQLTELKRLINGGTSEALTGGNFRSLINENYYITSSDTGIHEITLEIARDRAQNLYKGYLVYNIISVSEYYCYLIYYAAPNNQTIGIIKIEPNGAYSTYSFCNPLTILELRSEINDALAEAGGDSGDSAKKGEIVLSQEETATLLGGGDIELTEEEYNVFFENEIIIIRAETEQGNVYDVLTINRELYIDYGTYNGPFMAVIPFYDSATEKNILIRLVVIKEVISEEVSYLLISTIGNIGSFDTDIVSQIAYDVETNGYTFPKGVLPIKIETDTQEYYFDYNLGIMVDNSGDSTGDNVSIVENKVIIYDTEGLFNNDTIQKITYILFDVDENKLNTYNMYYPQSGTKLYEHKLVFGGGYSDNTRIAYIGTSPTACVRTYNNGSYLAVTTANDYVLPMGKIVKYNGEAYYIDWGMYDYITKKGGFKLLKVSDGTQADIPEAFSDTVTEL